MKTYCDLIDLIKREQEDDKAFAFHISIASAVASNINLKEYDGEGINELCKRIENCLLNHSEEWPDIDEMVYRIQQSIDDGVYETPTEECVWDAFEASLY